MLKDPGITRQVRERYATHVDKKTRRVHHCKQQCNIFQECKCSFNIVDAGQIFSLLSLDGQITIPNP